MNTVSSAVSYGIPSFSNPDPQVGAGSPIHPDLHPDGPSYPKADSTCASPSRPIPSAAGVYDVNVRCGVLSVLMSWKAEVEAHERAHEASLNRCISGGAALRAELADLEAIVGESPPPVGGRNGKSRLRPPPKRWRTWRRGPPAETRRRKRVPCSRSLATSGRPTRSGRADVLKVFEGSEPPPSEADCYRRFDRPCPAIGGQWCAAGSLLHLDHPGEIGAPPVPGPMEHVISFGGEGEGPGEFTGRPSAITIQEDLVVVADRSRLYFFLPSGEYVDNRVLVRREPALAVLGCAPRLFSGMAAKPTAVLVVERCLSTTNQNDENEARVVTDDGTVLVSVPDGPPRMIDVDASLVLADHPLGFVFGSTGDDCLGLYGSDGEEIERLCHGWMRRVPVPGWYVDTLEAVARRRSLDVEFRAESLPRFTRVFSVFGGQLAYARPMGADEIDPSLSGPHGASRLVVADGYGGERVLPLPAAPIVFASGGSALLAWPEMEGTRLLIATLPEHGR